jgi:hypothetical protein
MRIMDAIEQTIFFDRTIAIPTIRPRVYQYLDYQGILQEIVMTKNHADIILTTGYFSVAAMVFLFISMFLFTTLHP